MLALCALITAITAENVFERPPKLNLPGNLRLGHLVFYYMGTLCFLRRIDFMCKLTWLDSKRCRSLLILGLCAILVFEPKVLVCLKNNNSKI